MSDDVWDGAEPVVMLAEMKTCNGTTVAGGAVAHSRRCPFHGDTWDGLRAEVAALTAERDRLQKELEHWYRAEIARAGRISEAYTRGAVVIGPDGSYEDPLVTRMRADRDTLAAQLARAETVISGPLSTLTLDAVQAEAIRARAKHGERTVLNREMPAGEKVAILGEEFGEVCRALTYDQDRTKLVGELIQVASVSLLWVESIEGQATPATTEREGAGDGDPA